MTTDWFLDGIASDRDSVYKALTSTADAENLVRSGGILFQAYCADPVFRIGMLPVISGGRRFYHHEIKLGTNVWPRSVGQFSTDHTIRLLVPPKPGEQPAATDPDAIRRQISGFCRHLVLSGIPGEIQFDWITRKWMSDTGLYDRELMTPVDALRGYVEDANL